MAKRKKRSKTEEVVVTTEDLQQIRLLANMIERNGFQVRRENLTRGHSYRVKSGDCVFSGSNIVFVDRRLPGKQQISLLVDFLVDQKLPLSTEDLSSVSEHTRSILSI